MRNNLYRVILLFILVMLPIQVGVAQDKKKDLKKTVAEFSRSATALEKAGSAQKVDDNQLIDLQDKIDALFKNIENSRDTFSASAKDIESQLKRLGPAPKKDAPPETDAVKSERKRLNRQFGEFDSAIKKASLLQARLTQLRRKIQERRLDVFTREIFHRYRSPFDGKFWDRVGGDYAKGLQQLTETLATPDEQKPSFWFILLAIISTSSLAFLLHRVCTHYIGRLRSIQVEGQGITFFRRAISAIYVSLLRFITPLGALLFFYVVLGNIGLFYGQREPLAQTALVGAVTFFMISAFSKTILAISRPQWRMFNLSDTAAITLLRCIQGTVLIFAINILWDRLAELSNPPLSMAAVYGLFSSVIFASILIIAARTTFAEAEVATEPPVRSRLRPYSVKLPLWITSVAILISLATGYISFATFLTDQVVITGAVIIIGQLFHIAIDEFTIDIRDEQTTVGSWFKTSLELDELRRKQVAFLINMILNLALLMIIIPIILFQWGFSWGDIKSWLSAALFGIQIGSVNLSLSTFAIALSLFALGIVLTRVIQKWLEKGPLTLSNTQDGVVDSVRTGVGYVGFALSLLIAISYAGVDFTNVAIVAGALSVGIGFGLQSIVNNFVSGLILLVERPVKVGDWVIVGDQQGYVRRISVRSTEIETFDRSSVIIPNSDLISSTITNWTHSNSVGRVIIPVGVSYSEDARKVYNILMDIGKEHPKCLTYPKPSVVFEDFGASSLDFTLRVFIANIRDVLEVKTELRMTILETFRDHNIEIPFPQRDLHIRSSETLNIQTAQAPKPE